MIVEDEAEYHKNELSKSKIKKTPEKMKKGNYPIKVKKLP